MREPAFCICKNKDADQLRGNREADQRLCFRYSDSIIPLLPKSENFKPLAIFCDCTARFVSDQVRNPEDRFSQNEAQIIQRQLFNLNIIYNFSEQWGRLLWFYGDGQACLSLCCPNSHKKVSP